MSLVPIYNAEIERGTLGGVLLAGALAVEQLTVDAGLRAPHFYLTQHQHVFRAMVELYDEHAAIDTNTVVDRLQRAGTLEAVGGPAMVDVLAGFAPAGGDWLSYGRLVRRDARRRAQLLAADEVKAAIEAGDDAALALAEAKLIAAGDEHATAATWDVEAARQHVFDYLAGDDSGIIRTPFPEVDRLLYGGLRRPGTSLIGGWTSHGKSTTADGFLDEAFAQGHVGHLYLNEMSLLTRGLRTLASMSGVPFGRLLQRALDERENERVLRALERGYPWGMTNCAGWRAEEISRHLRARRWPIAVIDSPNLIPHKGVEGIDEISTILTAAAHVAGTHLLLVVQLNKARAESAVLPPPVERDIRESGRLAYDSDNVFFIHRDQEEIVVDTPRGPMPTGEIRRFGTAMFTVAKARNGELGACVVALDDHRMRYTAKDVIPEVAA